MANSAIAISKRGTFLSLLSVKSVKYRLVKFSLG